MVAMKILKQYQCEHCNTVYKSESECMNCESSHNIIVQIKEAAYNGIKNDGEYPKSIVVEMSDGAFVTYMKGSVRTPRS